MSARHVLGPSAPKLPLDVLLATLPSLPRPILDRLTARMIERLDELEGDADLEACGDELDGSMAEDDFHPQNANWLGHPGCPVSDPGEAEQDGDGMNYGEDQRVVRCEWGRIRWEADKDGGSRYP